jgi:hypothetical protein
LFKNGLFILKKEKNQQAKINTAILNVIYYYYIKTIKENMKLAASIIWYIIVVLTVFVLAGFTRKMCNSNNSNIIKKETQSEIVFSNGQTKVYTIVTKDCRLFIGINEKNGCISLSR